MELRKFDILWTSVYVRSVNDRLVVTAARNILNTKDKITTSNPTAKLHGRKLNGRRAGRTGDRNSIYDTCRNFSRFTGLRLAVLTSKKLLSNGYRVILLR